MKKQIFLLIVVLLSVTTFAQSTSKRLEYFNLEKKVAIQGYDPVAYFKQSKAIKGKKEIAVAYEGVVYQFSTTTNKETFLKNPTAFEPQYGGWCAYAMGAKGTKVEIDPETFKIKDGKLYLFYNKTFTNTLPLWNKDEANLKTKADENWKIILSK